MSKMVSVRMTPHEKPCKHVVRFHTKDPDAPIESVYVSKTVPGIMGCGEITLHLQVGATPNAEDAELLATLGR